jgi:D(-)-tartrate dehydratase
MRIIDVRERTIPISRFADVTIPSGGLTTSLIAVVTDVIQSGKPVVGYGFASIGRYGQGGLIRERFAPRLLAASTLSDDSGRHLDPKSAWNAMMKNEKPGGHGERCVAVGSLDMAIWDAAAKIARQPLHHYLSERMEILPKPRVPVYASGGYRYPDADIDRLKSEIRSFTDLGFTRAKIKIGTGSIAHDLKRIEIAAEQLGQASHLAVDAMNAYDTHRALRAAHALAPLGLWWFEDVCDPLDFDTHSRIAKLYPGPIAAGEALFSKAEARLLQRYAGLREAYDILLFDPVHCYGLTHYCEIVADMTKSGWPRSAFWPHGGQLFSLHIAAALGLGGAEITPFAFAPFCGVASGLTIADGNIDLPQAPGIGFELHNEAYKLFQQLID